MCHISFLQKHPLAISTWYVGFSIWLKKLRRRASNDFMRQRFTSVAKEQRPKCRTNYTLLLVVLTNFLNKYYKIIFQKKNSSNQGIILFFSKYDSSIIWWFFKIWIIAEINSWKPNHRFEFFCLCLLMHELPPRWLA